jgi:cobalt-precorrin 5A hydrolase
VIAVGIGCRRDVSAQQVKAAVQHVLAQAGVELQQVHGLFTAEFKREQAALRSAAADLCKPLTFLSLADLAEHRDAVYTQSAHVIERCGLPSVAETAALAGARALAAGRVRLLGPRLVLVGVTCALAVSESNV